MTSQTSQQGTYTKHIDSLSSDVTGLLDKDLVLFRGIPFASLSKRWTHSQLRSSLPTSFDATKYGPKCTQGKTGLVLVTGGVDDEPVPEDEFDCLNLNITVPKEALDSKSSSKLPVMVWIHGGAFNYGCNSVSRYRPQRLASLALSRGKPIILVQIQYRLGPLGFIASHDLATEQTPRSEQSDESYSHLLGNYGFIDQVRALQWVRDHISSFGGDPNDVTAFGVSAGSASIHHHILSGRPLFDRAILMSGSAPTLGPLPFHIYEEAWQNLLKRVDGMTSKTSSERLEILRNLSPEDIIEKHSSAPLGPMGDDIILPSNWQYTSPQQPTRCKSIIIGDTQVEAIIMDGLIAATPFSKLSALVSAKCASPSAFYDAFNISEDMSEQAYVVAMREWLSLGMFQYPAVLVANTFPGDVYFYHFDEGSPYEGKTFGIPYHGQCALFTYMNDIEAYPEEAKTIAEDMGRVWTEFAASGRSHDSDGEKPKAPWEEYKVARRFMRFGPKGLTQLSGWNDNDVRNYKWLPWVEAHYEELRALTVALTVRP